VVDEEFYDDLFDELYERAVPGVEEIKSTEYPEDVNLPYLHFIDGEELEEVIEEYCSEYDVADDRVFAVKKAVVLGKGPSTSRSVVDSARMDAGLEPVSEMLEGGGPE
jgi:hypothetical protein